MIKFQDVTYRYPHASAPVLAGLCCAFNKGEMTAVTGKNGGGKTTFTKLAVGILRPESGSILIDGRDSKPMDLFDIGQKIGYIFQNPNRQLFCHTVQSEIAYGLENLGLPQQEIDRKIDHYSEFFRIGHLRKSFPGSLSYGEKQRVALASVMALDTAYLVLDEPESGLDIRAREELYLLLKQLRDEKGVGIIVVTHERQLASRYADREWVVGK